MTALDDFKIELTKLNIGSSRQNTIESLADILYTEAKREGVTDESDHILFHLDAIRLDNIADADKVAKIDFTMEAVLRAKTNNGSITALTDGLEGIG